MGTIHDRLLASIRGPVPGATGHASLRLPRRAVLIHGGQHKTGTTAIQNTFYAHRAQLRKRGWLYPEAGLLELEQTGFRHRNLMVQLRRGDPAHLGQWSKLRREMRKWSGRTLISHENFFSPEIDPARLREQLPGADIYLLVYLRHPVDYIESCYRQWVRRGGFKEGIRAFYDWRKAWLDIESLLDRWEAVIGRGQVRFRVYDRSQFVEGSVVRDFFSQLGLDLRGGAGNESLNSLQILIHLIANLRSVRPANVEALSSLVSDAGQVERTLAALPDLLAREYPEPGQEAALRCLLASHRPDTRIIDDALCSEIESRYRPSYERALQRTGVNPGTLGAAGCPAQARYELFDSPELRAAVELLLK